MSIGRPFAAVTSTWVGSEAKVRARASGLSATFAGLVADFAGFDLTDLPTAGLVAADFLFAGRLFDELPFRFAATGHSTSGRY
ncbi:MAG: hypothetical protein C0497_11540 [Gemmatimonas sp.]|nr:hypothetical protein [Gemmatimonas sp.]